MVWLSHLLVIAGVFVTLSVFKYAESSFTKKALYNTLAMLPCVYGKWIEELNDATKIVFFRDSCKFKKVFHQPKRDFIMKLTLKKCITLIFILTAPALAHAQTEPPAKEITCRVCHGASGAAPIAPNYPKLNGQNKVYLVSSLKAYRDGQRKGGLAGVMAAQAAQLSDADIEALAAYYASQK
jgi:cytochrome c